MIHPYLMCSTVTKIYYMYTVIFVGTVLIKYTVHLELRGGLI